MNMCPYMPGRCAGLTFPYRVGDMVFFIDWHKNNLFSSCTFFTSYTISEKKRGEITKRCRK